MEDNHHQLSQDRSIGRLAWQPERRGCPRDRRSSGDPRRLFGGVQGYASASWRSHCCPRQSCPHPRPVRIVARECCVVTARGICSAAHTAERANATDRAHNVELTASHCREVAPCDVAVADLAAEVARLRSKVDSL